MGLKDKKEVIKALEDCISYINKQLGKKETADKPKPKHTQAA